MSSNGVTDVGSENSEKNNTKTKTNTMKESKGETVSSEKKEPIDGNEGNGGEDTEQKDKKKKKKKPAKKEEKKDTKDTKKGGPSKKMLSLMKENLQKLNEEEEKFKREEEERIEREEEAERQRLERLRIEQEKKDRKKQKDKERKERLKKEGKLLNAKQKADKQRAQASLAAAIRDGQIVVGRQKPKSEKKVKSGDKSSVKPLESQGSEEQTDSLPKEDEESDEESEASDLDVKDDWEELSEGDLGEDKEEVKTPKKEKEVVKRSESITKPIKELTIKDEKLEKFSDGEPPKRQFRSPVVCVLGHVDTGKTKLLDYIRKSHVQDGEAGGITQQIGATFVPPSAIEEQTKGVKATQKKDLLLPGLLIIDTPGHESFSNLRSRGSSLCDIAILVIDIMHGLEPQTIESIELLKARKTPFIVALNKIDRLYEWRSNPRKDVEDVIGSQVQNTKLEFTKRVKEVIVELAQQSINAALYYENYDFRSYVSLVPTSASSGDGMGNLIALLISLTQSMMAKKVAFDPINLDATVLEVKAIPGLGTTIDVILVNGKLREGDKIVLAGHEGPFVTHIRSILMPQPLKELRIKSPYQELKIVYGSMGVKIAGHDLDKAIAGLQLLVAENETQIEEHKNYIWSQFGKAMKAIKCSDKGVYVQASTLGSLEALLEFLKTSKIPYCGVRIGPVVKRDVMKASIMLESSPDHAVILAFDVRIERDAQELADHLGVKIFSAEIIYHLFDRFTAYKEELRKQRRDQNKNLAVFPCKLRILPNCVFNTRDPIVVGVSIEDGLIIPGTPLAVPSKANIEIGRITTIEINHKAVEIARKGQEVCIKIENFGGDAPKLYGRHFDHTDLLMSRLTRESIDVVKEYFRDDLQKSDWQLMIELKKIFEII
ncbi:unnamed protein product [Medioppia subpectinata]|uniref:Eukaryotic translation initiation factor 5B n=1 Tax=Medioppia subpectinata TaxID=1979941 RepID=A0A7R9KMW4_9ACAR|nr:unnamed protein product [Medioppia subpectinata]CAG2106460.1 unnamed protein product [Medioppia subpectinata]